MSIESPLHTESMTDDRPRILAISTDFERAARTIDSDEYAASWYQNVRTHTDRLFAESLVPNDVPENLRSVREVTGRLWRLAFMFRHTGEARFAERAWEAIEQLIELDDWHPQAFLRTAELAAGVATAYDWCFEHWTPEQRSSIRSALLELVLKEALRGYRRSAAGGEYDERTWWVECEHNWNTVCNGGVVMAAIAIAGTPERDSMVTEILAGARTSIQRALSAVGRDGGWGEGPIYWGYMSRYLTFYLSTLENAFGAIPAEHEVPGLARTGFFPIYTLGDGKTFNFGDGGPIKLNAPQLFWLGDRYDQPEFAGYQREMLGIGNPIGEPYREQTGNTGGANDWGVLSVLWYRPDQVAAVEELPLDRVFEDTGVATFRDSWTSNMRFVGVKGGDNRINHSHLDLGSFVFDALGTRWACDLGADDYSLDGYFEDKRWEYYRLRTEGHNTLVIDPEESPNQSTTATAPIISHDSNNETAYAVIDLTDAYPERVRSLRRGVTLLQDRSSLLIRDELITDTAINLNWFLHTEATVEANGESVLLRRDDERLRVTVRDPPSASIEVADAAPLTASPDHPEQADNDGVTRLEIAVEDVQNPTCTVSLEPLDEDSNAAQGVGTVPELSEWSLNSLDSEQRG